MRAVSKFTLKMGKLNLPLECYKCVDNTTSIYAKEVAKINGKIYKVQRKAYVTLDDGSEVDIDSGQILKQYERNDGEIAVFTKEEQTQLLKKGSSKDWVADTIVNKNVFNELSFQKDGIIAMVEMVKKKELINKKNLKFFSMLKAGLGEDKAIVTQILYKNVEYPVAITTHGDNLLIRFLHYKDEIRNLEGQQIPQLNEKEQEQAKAFITQFVKPNFDLEKYENKTEEMVRKLIESRGIEEVSESKVEEAMLEEDNPFI